MTEARVDTRSDSATKLSSSAGILMARQLVAYAMTAVSSMFVVRSLAPDDFGLYATGLAAYALFLGLIDVGFGQVLARYIGTAGGDVVPVVRRIVSVHLTWSAGVAALALLLGALWGVESTSGWVLAVMTPAIAAAGASSLRQICYWQHAVRPMARVDLSLNAVQAVVLVLMARQDAPLLALAATMCACSFTNTVLVSRIALRLLAAMPQVEDSHAPVWSRRLVLRRSLFLGLALFVPTAYYQADMVLIHWLTDENSVGQYAAAVKFLSIFVMLPTVIMSFALPHLAAAAQDREELAALTRQVASWFAALLLPVCVFLAAFAPLVVALVYGDAYRASAPLLAILMAGAAVTLTGYLPGNLMIAEGRARWLLGQNVLALVVNVVGNVLLVPQAGAAAAAWLTVTAEVMVAGASIVAVRHRLPYRAMLEGAGRPVLAVVPVVLLGVLWGQHLGAGLAAIVGYLLLMWLLAGWPEDVARLVPFANRGSGRPRRAVGRTSVRGAGEE